MRCAVCNEVRKVLTCSVAAGIVDQVTSTISNAVNYVSETVQGKSAEAEKEGNKESAFLFFFAWTRLFLTLLPLQLLYAALC